MKRILCIALALLAPATSLAGARYGTDSTARAGTLTLTQAPVTLAPFTFVAWARPNNVTSAMEALTITNSSSATNYVILGFRGDQLNDPIGFSAFESTPAQGAGVASALGQGSFTTAWTFLGGSCRASNSWTVYCDGRPSSTNTSTCIPDGLNTVTIGGANYGGSFSEGLAGVQSFAAVYSVGLSDTAMHSLAQGQHPLRGPHRNRLVVMVPCEAAGTGEPDRILGKSFPTSLTSRADRKPGIVRGGR